MVKIKVVIWSLWLELFLGSQGKEVLTFDCTEGTSSTQISDVHRWEKTYDGHMWYAHPKIDRHVQKHTYNRERCDRPIYLFVVFTICLKATTWNNLSFEPLNTSIGLSLDLKGSISRKRLWSWEAIRMTCVILIYWLKLFIDGGMPQVTFLWSKVQRFMKRYFITSDDCDVALTLSRCFHEPIRKLTNISRGETTGF